MSVDIPILNHLTQHFDILRERYVKTELLEIIANGENSVVEFRLATKEQQMRLFELGGMLHTELMPVPSTDITKLAAGI